MKEEEYQLKISQYLDRELSPEEKSELIRFLDINKAARSYLKKQKSLREVVRAMKFVEPDEEVFNEFWPNIFNRLSKGIGWILIITGSLIVLAYSIYQFIVNPMVDAFEKIVTFAIIIGFLLLLVAVLHQRIREYKTDKYKDVIK